MGTYNLPRSVKGEGRILFIFSGKGLLYTVAFGGIGLIFYFIFSMINLKMVGIVITLIFAVIGFAIGTLKMPKTKAFQITKKTGDEYIDDILKRYIKFKRQKNKIYVYKTEKNINKGETTDE